MKNTGKKTKDEAQEYSEKNNDMIKKTVIDFDWEKWITSHLILEHIELCGRITFMFFVDTFHCRKKIARFFTRSDLGYVEERKVLSKRVEKLFDFRYYSTSSQPSHIRLCQALWLMCHEEVKLIFILSVVIPYEIYDFLWRFFHLYHCASHLLEVGVSPALLA